MATTPYQEKPQKMGKWSADRKGTLVIIPTPRSEKNQKDHGTRLRVITCFAIVGYVFFGNQTDDSGSIG
jgi:hypothetical protein